MSFRWVLVAFVYLAACDPPRPIPPDAAIPDAPVLCHRGSLDLAVTTLAGCEQHGTDDGDRETARFDNPVNVELAPDGSIFVADFDNSLLRKVAPDGTTTTLVSRPDFARPFGLALADNGTLYVETDNNDAGEHTDNTGTIWAVDPNTGDATVIARNLGRPRGLAVLPDGRIAMADHVHHVITLLDPLTGIEVTLAGQPNVAGHLNGTGLATLFAQPYDLVRNADGDLIVTELDNHVLRRVTLTGIVTDYAGSGLQGAFDGPVAVAAFDGPQGLTRAPDGTLYVTDIHRSYVRRIKDGVVKTIAGDGTRGWLDSDDPRGARFYGLEGIAADATRIIVTDGNRGDGRDFHRIRIIRADAVP